MVDSVHGMIRVPEQRVGEAGLEEIHREEGGDGNDLVEQDVDTLPVPDILPRALLTQPDKFVLFFCVLYFFVFFYLSRLDEARARNSFSLSSISS